jgi:deoxyribonuclease-4
MSIAGGLFRAVERAAEVGCDCVQLFTGNPRSFPKHARDPKTRSTAPQRLFGDDQVGRFAATLAETGVEHPISHSSYLINLASPDPQLWLKSIDTMEDELRRAGELDIPYVVVHPGAHTTASSEAGMENIVRALDELEKRLPDEAAHCLLETTAGQGTCLGWQFEQLGEMLNGVRCNDRLGVCVDTCHVFAAGYELAERRDYLATIRRLDKAVGLERVKAFHLNDSKTECGSRVDRHDHIGFGEMGVEPFRHLVNDRRFRKTPMYLETRKGEDESGELWDKINLQTLRDLA